MAKSFLASSLLKFSAVVAGRLLLVSPLFATLQGRRFNDEGGCAVRKQILQKFRSSRRHAPVGTLAMFQTRSVVLRWLLWFGTIVMKRGWLIAVENFRIFSFRPWTHEQH